MASLTNYRNTKNHPFSIHWENKVKPAMEIRATAKGLFDIGRSMYQGAATYGPMIANGLNTIGPMVATASLL